MRLTGETGEACMALEFQSKKHDTLDKTEKFYWRDRSRTKYDTRTYPVTKHAQAYRKKPRRSTMKISKSGYESLIQRISQLEERVAEFEIVNDFLTSALSNVKAEQVDANPPQIKSPKSTLRLFGETFGIQALPENPAEKLRGLLSEFGIEESSTDMVRDVRGKR